MTGKQKYNQLCPVALSLDVVGSRWALLVVRELLLGPRRFKEIHLGLETASTDMVTSRLREMETEGIVERLADRRYQLTASGDALAPVIRALMIWAPNALSSFSDLKPNLSAEVDLPRRFLGALALVARDSKPSSKYLPQQIVVGHIRASITVESSGYRITESNTDNSSGTIDFDPDGLLEFIANTKTVAQLQREGKIQLIGPESAGVLADLAAGIAAFHEEISHNPVHMA